MAFLEWDNSLSVNVAEIDDQHKQLFEMISAYYEALRTDNSQAMKALLDSLVTYATFHFAAEEKYFDRFAYAGTEAHKNEHRLFTDKILDIKTRLESGKLVSSFEITNFLRSWIIEHISSSDKQYCACFASHGLR